jgi:putative transposase
MATYLGFPRRLRHDVPGWVRPCAVFHVRIAVDRVAKGQTLIDSGLAKALLESVMLYEDGGRWHVTVFLLMPDHLHALLSFAPDQQMSRIIADWKGFHARKRGIKWQEGFFDHRLRNDERGEQLSAKASYIRRNPVAAGLCERVEDWPWVYPPCKD